MKTLNAPGAEIVSRCGLQGKEQRGVLNLLSRTT
jgi:hypothetical protein